MAAQASDRNRPYNNLPLLPPPQGFESEPEILKKMVTASRALATVSGNMMRLPNPSMLVNTISLQEARTSTEIENIFTTNDELYKAISDSAVEEKANPATKEVLRYREALWTGYQSIKDHNRIDMASIISIYRQIKNTTGGFRSPQANVVIRRGASELKPGEIIYTPPRGEGIIENLLDNLLEYSMDDEKYPTDPLIKMCVAHYQFEAIHPFSDGNGRTGRIMNLLYLVNKGLLDQPTLYLSKFIILHKEEYYYSLSAVTQRGSWDKWILFMLDAVEKTSGLTNFLIREILDQMGKTYDYGKSRMKWYSKELNEEIFSQPYIRPKSISKLLGKKSRTTLTKYMSELVSNRILTPRKDGTNVYYLNDDLIRILEG